MDKPLSPQQSAALFDLLSHYNTYEEIRDFREPDSLDCYGPPFDTPANNPSRTPSLQGLVSKFIIKLPGLKDVPKEFWTVQIKDIIQEFEIANLSESYDSGIIGTRKTVATAISALIEYPVRGTMGRFSKVQDPSHDYDISKAEDLVRAFRNMMDEVIYGDLTGRLVKKMTETDQLSDHEPLILAAHEFLLVNIASFMHYSLVLSPKGQYLLKLLSHANKLVPYMVIRQTLKIGNVASMINGLLKIVLAKVSLTSVTNWIGLTHSENEGMNLMQQIISTVLHWDKRDLESRASKIESDSPLSKEQLQCLKAYVSIPRDEQKAIRYFSEQSSTSIVVAILSSSSLPTDLSESAHQAALEYLSCMLSVRDRNEIVRVICRSKPDHVTRAIRTAVSAYEPVIRNIHKAVDLPAGLSDFEAFLKDTLKVGRIPPPGKDNETVIPTVGDFVQLLKKHQYSCHKFLHQCCKNGKELTSWYQKWAEEAAACFRRSTSASIHAKDAGDLTEPLNDLFSKLQKPQQENVLRILDQQIEYLDNLHASSMKRLDAVIKSPASNNPVIAKVLSSGSNKSSRDTSPTREIETEGKPLIISSQGPQPNPGPGTYLARWESLLRYSPMTPLSPKGVDTAQDDVTKDLRPDPRVVIDLMASDFRALLGKRSLYW